MNEEKKLDLKLTKDIVDYMKNTKHKAIIHLSEDLSNVEYIERGNVL